MDFPAEIERAKREVAAAQGECGNAMARLGETMQRLGVLIGTYHGLAALDTNTPTGSSTRTIPSSRLRAPKGEARRRAVAILNRVAPEGRLLGQLLELAAMEGQPISEATMRRALAELRKEGRTTAIDGIWYAVTGNTNVRTEAAGARESNPVASSEGSHQGGQQCRHPDELLT